MKKFLFWLAYGIATVGATAHTYQVFRLSDPNWLAMCAAIGVDSLLAYCLYTLGERTGNQRTAGLVGVVVLATISATAQIVQRFNGLSVGLLPWMQWASLFLVPVATTGGIVLLGALHYFDGGQRPFQQGQGKQGRPNFNAPPQERPVAVHSENGREREHTALPQ